MSAHTELIAQGRHEVDEDRRIAGIMRQDRNRKVMEHRAAVTERLCDALDRSASEIRTARADAVRQAATDYAAMVGVRDRIYDWITDSAIAIEEDQ